MCVLQELQPIKLIQEYPIFRRSELPYSSGPGVTHFTVTNQLASMIIVGNVILRFPIGNLRNIERELLARRELLTLTMASHVGT